MTRALPPIGPRNVPLVVTALVLIGVYVFGAVTYDHFLSWAVLRNLLVDNAFLGVAAAGATLVILSGGIDLSVGSVMALSGVVVASLVSRGGVHPVVAIGVALVGGTLFGSAQGFLVHAFRLPAFLVTLAGMFLARGLAFAVHPQSLAIDHPFFSELLADTLSIRLPLGPRGTVIPVSVLVMLVVFVAMWILLRRTQLGRFVHAIGDHEPSAALMGVPVGRVRVKVFAGAGFLSALAGVLLVLYQRSGDPASGQGLELDAIAAVVIGGTLLRGGVGSIIGTFFGVAILGLIQTLITFQGNLSSWWTSIAVGGLVLVFLVVHRALESVATRVVRPPPT